MNWVMMRGRHGNQHRFPSDFMFELTGDEYNSLRSQFGTFKRVKGFEMSADVGFTEQGVAMIKSVAIPFIKFPKRELCC